MEAVGGASQAGARGFPFEKRKSKRGRSDLSVVADPSVVARPDSKFLPPPRQVPLAVAAAVAALEVLLHIHTVVKNSDNNDPGFRAGAVKDDMAALTELFVPWLYVIGIAANIRLARQQLESIVKLL